MARSVKKLKKLCVRCYFCVTSTHQFVCRPTCEEEDERKMNGLVRSGRAKFVERAQQGIIIACWCNLQWQCCADCRQFWEIFLVDNFFPPTPRAIALLSPNSSDLSLAICDAASHTQAKHHVYRVLINDRHTSI